MSTEAATAISSADGPARVIFPRVQSDRAATEAARDRGYVQGHAAGYAAGLRAAAAEQELRAQAMHAEHDAVLTAARKDADGALRILHAAAAAFQQCFELVLQDGEEVLAESALELAEAVLAYELHDGERTARAALRRALGGRKSGPPAAVRLHPADLAALQVTGVAAEAALELVPDPSLSQGDAVAQYPDGWLDARLGTALARAREALLSPGNHAVTGPGQENQGSPA